MFTNILSWFGTKESHSGPAFSAREVWLYRHIDPRTRRTSTRPVLVYRKASDGMFWGLPLVKTTRNGKAHYVPRLVNGKRVPILSQMRTLKAARLTQKLGQAGEKEFATLNASILRMLADMTPTPTKRSRAIAQPRFVQPRRIERTLSPFQPVYILQPR